jgi:hypothetical protein
MSVLSEVDILLLIMKFVIILTHIIVTYSNILFYVIASPQTCDKAIITEKVAHKSSNYERIYGIMYSTLRHLLKV